MVSYQSLKLFTFFWDTLYLSENEAKNLQNGNVHLAQIPDFEMEYLENHSEHWGQWWLDFFAFFTLFYLS